MKIVWVSVTPVLMIASKHAIWMVHIKDKAISILGRYEKHQCHWRGLRQSGCCWSQVGWSQSN